VSVSRIRATKLFQLFQVHIRIKITHNYSKHLVFFISFCAQGSSDKSFFRFLSFFFPVTFHLCVILSPRTLAETIQFFFFRAKKFSPESFTIYRVVQTRTLDRRYLLITLAHGVSRYLCGGGGWYIYRAKKLINDSEWRWSPPRSLSRVASDSTNIRTLMSVYT